MSSEPQTSDAISLWTQALERWKEGNVAATRSACEQLLALEERHAGALHLLALIAYGENQFSEARDKAQAAVEIAPNFAIFHNTLGAVLVALEKSDLAEAAFRKALQVDPAHAEAHGNLGNLLKKRKRHEEAIAHFEK